MGVPSDGNLPDLGFRLRYPLIQTSPPPPRIISALDSSVTREIELCLRSSATTASRSFSEPALVVNGSTYRRLKPADCQPDTCQPNKGAATMQYHATHFTCKPTIGVSFILTSNMVP